MRVTFHTGGSDLTVSTVNHGGGAVEMTVQRRPDLSVGSANSTTEQTVRAIQPVPDIDWKHTPLTVWLSPSEAKAVASALLGAATELKQ